MSEFKEKSQKPTAFEINRRLDIVEELLIKGLSSKTICSYLEEKEKISVHIKTVERYVTRVNKRWEKARAPHRQREIQKAIRRYELWMAKSDMIQDYRTAAKIQSMLSKLLGLDAPSKMEMKAEVTEVPAIDFSKLSTEELRMLRSLLEKAKPDKKRDKDGP